MNEETKNKLNTLTEKLADSEFKPELIDFIRTLNNALLSNEDDIDSLVELLKPIARFSTNGAGLNLIIKHLEKIENDCDEEACFLERIGD